jgi:hypothetical protein
MFSANPPASKGPEIALQNRFTHFSTGFMQTSCASFTNLTYVFNANFGNFLFHNTHNFVLYQIIDYTFEGQARNTIDDFE